MSITAKQRMEAEYRRLLATQPQQAGGITGGVIFNPGVPATSTPSTPPEPTASAKLYCPAHGKIDDGLQFGIMLGGSEGKSFCPKCVATALERIGVHQMTDKAPAQVKKW